MKSILHLKFIVLYIIFGFLCVFTTATLTNELIMDRLEEDISQSLYREATLISNNYLPSYFSEDSSIWAVQSQLIAMRLYLNSSLWFVAPDGSLITSSNIRGTTAPRTIENFDPAEIGNSQYITGTYHDYFDEDFITVMAPVTQGFSTKGYLLIHHPVSDIQKQCSLLMRPVYITLAVIFGLSSFSCWDSTSLSTARCGRSQRPPSSTPWGTWIMRSRFILMMKWDIFLPP